MNDDIEETSRNLVSHTKPSVAGGAPRQRLRLPAVKQNGPKEAEGGVRTGKAKLTKLEARVREDSSKWVEEEMDPGITDRLENGLGVHVLEDGCKPVVILRGWSRVQDRLPDILKATK